MPYANAFVLKDALLTLGGTDFGSQVNSATLTPDSNVQTMRTIVPDGQISDVDSALWTFTIKGLQDSEDGGLAAFLTENAGEYISAVYAPRKGAGLTKWTFQVLCLPVAIGGDQGVYAPLDVALPVQGQPTASAQV